MAQNLFGAQVPALRNNADGEAYCLGTRFIPAVAGVATHSRWYFPQVIPDIGLPVLCGIFRNQGELLLGSGEFPIGATLDAWNETPFVDGEGNPAPIPLEPGVEYSTVIWTPLRYVATAAYPWPITSGDLTSTTIGGRFAGMGAGNPPSLVFPSANFNSGNYFVDLVFVPDGAEIPSAAPAGVAVPVTLGEPGTEIGSAAADGLAVPVTLGEPGAAVPGAVAAGLGVPVALGSPGVGLPGASPAGLAVPVALGADPGTALIAAGPDGLNVPVRIGTAAAGARTRLPLLYGSAAVRPGPAGAASVLTLGGSAAVK